MEQYAIEVRNLTKIIKGRRILDNVNLTVRAGEAVGFIGPNGAGKTTLIRILAGMSRPTEGEVRVLGQRVDGRGAGPSDIGLLVETPGFVEHLSARRNLRMLASIRGLIPADKVDETIRMVGLDPDDRRPVAKYSLGMRQRLALAQALMEQPRVLILDEPTNGLDVVGIAELRETIRQQLARGVAVFLASHLLSEVELACDAVLMVHRGRVLQQLSTDELSRATAGIRLAVSSEADWERVAATFPCERFPAPGRVQGILRVSAGVPEVVRQLVALGVAVEEIAPERISLERAFFAEIEAAAR